MLGTEVGSVTAVDRDGPPYNRFRYSLRPAADDVDSAAFEVDANTGALRTTRPLDRERQAVYRLTAVATEMAYPHASSTANVTVFVADRNDNAPVIDQPSSSNNTAVVSLYASPGHVFARVTATDPDWGVNSHLRYAITGGDQPSAAGAFHIGADSGAVSVRRDLNVVLPAHLTRLSLIVLVRDSGLPSRNATATLNILIDRSTAGRDSSRRGRVPVGRGGDVTGNWLTTFGGEFRREFLILLASGTAMLIIVLLLAIICIRRRQLAVLATGGADQIQPQRGRDDTKSLPPIIDVGWSSNMDQTGCRGSNCDPEFQIVRNIVESPWDAGRQDSPPWKAATLQSPSRMTSAAGHGDDPELCHLYVTAPTTLCASTTGREHRTPQLQTFSVSFTRLLNNDVFLQCIQGALKISAYFELL